MNETDNTRRARAWILVFLSQEPANGNGLRAQLTPERLQKMLFEASYHLSFDQVRSHLAYLKGKRLVEVELFTGAAARVLGGTATGVRITSDGVDVVEKTKAEPGVDLGIFG